MDRLAKVKLQKRYINRGEDTTTLKRRNNGWRPECALLEKVFMYVNYDNGELSQEQSRRARIGNKQSSSDRTHFDLKNLGSMFLGASSSVPWNFFPKF